LGRLPGQARPAGPLERRRRHQTPQKILGQAENDQARDLKCTDSASDRRKDLDAVLEALWGDKAAKFRDNAADLTEAKRLANQMLSPDAPQGTPETEQRISEIAAEKDPQAQSRSEGWRLHGKDRTPRAPRNRGGHDSHHPGTGLAVATRNGPLERHPRQ
jgi:hypothetical protein